MSLESENSGAGKIAESDVVKLIAEALDVPASMIHADTVAEDVAEWDSMGILSILTLLDKHGIACEIGNTDALRSAKSVIELFRTSGKLE
jgi:acyl carrier protein